MELTSRQKTRRNQIQSLVDDNRPLATWVVEQMTDEEDGQFDEALPHGDDAAKAVVGYILQRLGHGMAGEYLAELQEQVNETNQLEEPPALPPEDQVARDEDEA